MAHLIDKDALVAEIEKLKGKVSDSSSYCNGWQHALRMLELSLDTLEVKEVDLEKLSISEYRIKELIFAFWTGLQTFETSWYSYADAYSQGIKDILEELGLKAQKGE